LLDEPFSNLDEALRSRIGAEIVRLANEHATTVILATHDPEDAAIAPDVVLRFCNAQYVMETIR
jgi:ABC-type nitrate/sulfonate/bicarbonate transport system ATPase subunit